MRPRHTWRTAAAAALLATLLAGCGGSPEGPVTNPPPSPSPSGPTSSTPEGDVRARLAQSLRPSSPASARLVENPGTTLDPLDTPWLTGWQVLDVKNGTMAHPQRFYAALADDGRAELLTDDPQSFDAVVATGGVAVTASATARAVSDTYLDVTRDFVAYAYRIDGIDDVVWLPSPTEADRASRTALEKAYRSRIQAPAPTRSGSSWRLTQWMVDGRTLVRHELTVAADGTVTDDVRTVEDALPVPTSV